MSIDVTCTPAGLLKVTLYNPETMPLPRAIQQPTPTCNYEHYLLIGESKSGEYYLTVKPDPLSVGIGYDIELRLEAQNDAGRGKDAADVFRTAEPIEKGNHDGGVGDLDEADYYKFKATSDTELQFQVLKDVSLDLVLLDDGGVEVCRKPVREAPDDEVLPYSFEGADLGPGCERELGAGEYSVGVIGQLDSEDLYTIVLR